MKKTQKQIGAVRKLTLQREVVAQLRPQELVHAEGAVNVPHSPPRCPTSWDLPDQG